MSVVLYPITSAEEHRMKQMCQLFSPISWIFKFKSSLRICGNIFTFHAERDSISSCYQGESMSVLLMNTKL